MGLQGQWLAEHITSQNVLLVENECTISNNDIAV